MTDTKYSFLCRMNHCHVNNDEAAFPPKHTETRKELRANQEKHERKTIAFAHKTLCGKDVVGM